MLLLAFVAIAAAINLFRYSGWIAAVFAILAYVLIQAALQGYSIAILTPVLAFALAVIVTTWLGVSIALQVDLLVRLLRQQQKLVDDLRAYEPNTGLLRTNYMQTPCEPRSFAASVIKRTCVFCFSMLKIPKKLSVNLARMALTTPANRSPSCFQARCAPLICPLAVPVWALSCPKPVLKVHRPWLTV